MTIDDKKLEIVSNEVKDSIGQLRIVTPTMYSSIYAEYAQKNNISLENENVVGDELMSLECSKLTTLQENTSKNANALSKNTQDAIHAIQTKNEDKLNEVLQETQHLRKEIEKLKESIYKDELTNAYNRKWLHDNYLYSDSDSFMNDGVLVIIDLNYFKQVNDTHGHVIGDKVLIFITNELKKLKRPVVRYGGDEFIIIFDENEEKVSLHLNTLRDAILTKKLKANETTFTASFSFGISTYKASERLNQVIERADTQMYDDKIKIKERIKGI